MTNISNNISLTWFLEPKQSSGMDAIVTDMLTNCTILFLGICSVIVNGIILTLAILNRSLRRDAKRIQIALSIADIILGFGSIVQTLDRWRIQFWNDWYTASYCISLGMITFFGDSLSLMFTFIMAIERLIAIWYPIQYRTSNKQLLAHSLIITALSLVIIFCGSSLHGINWDIKPSICSGSHIRIQPLRPMLSYYNCTVGCLVIFLYCFNLYGLLVKAKTNLVAFPAIALYEKEQYKKEIEATKVITIIIVGCIMFFVVPNVIVAIITWIKSDFQAGTYVSMLGLVHASLSFILYIWKDKRMRQAFMNLIGRKNKNPVTRTVTASFTIPCRQNFHGVETLMNTNIERNAGTQAALKYYE